MDFPCFSTFIFGSLVLVFIASLLFDVLKVFRLIDFDCWIRIY